MEKLKKVIHSLEGIKATEIKVIDMQTFSPYFDYFVLANVKTIRQANAAISHVKDEMEQNNYPIKNIEGKNSNWILIDLGDILVNVFTEEQRLYYNLDKLFLDMPIIDLETLK